MAAFTAVCIKNANLKQCAKHIKGSILMNNQSGNAAAISA